MDQSTILTLLQSHRPVWSEILQRIQNDEANLSGVGGANSTRSQTSWVDPLTGVTALHLAVDVSSNKDVDKGATDSPAERSNSNNNSDERLLVIQELLSRHPEANMMQCQSRRWTPLATALAGIVARTTTARLYVKTSNNINSKRSATQDVEIIQALLETNPAATLLTDKLGRSPLCLYIQATSSYYRTCDEHETPPPPPQPRLARLARASADDCRSTARDGLLEIAKALVAASSKNRDNGSTLLSNAIETLYRCNTMTIMNMTTKLLELNRQTDETTTTRKSDKSNPQAAKLLDQCWIWHWLKCLLSGLLHCQRLHNQKQPPKGSRASSSSTSPVPNHTKVLTTTPKDLDPSLLLHVAARLVDCPTPFVLWTLVRDPSQVSMTTSNTIRAAAASNQRELKYAYTDGNLPLHSVASWRYDVVATSSTSASAASPAVSSTGRSTATKATLPQPPPPNQAAPTPTTLPEPELVPAPVLRNKCRKSMILTSLVAAYPPAVKIKNRSGYNPIELEAASGAVIT